MAPEAEKSLTTPSEWVSLWRMGHIVIAGVSGCGKSTVGRLLAARLDRPFLDGDEFHPMENIAKMRSGRPLNDEDRAAWLSALGAELAAREPVVLACSALKRSYRDQLRAAAGTVDFVLLQVEATELRRRMEQRGGHFMPASLLESQLATLEIGEDLIVLNNEAEAPDTVVEICRALGFVEDSDFPSRLQDQARGVNDA